MTRITRSACLVGALLSLLPAVAAAQGTTGSISGTITDEQKAVLPGVTILVIQTETGADRAQVSDEHGRYRVLDLPPGPYQIRAEIAGFNTTVHPQASAGPSFHDASSNGKFQATIAPTTPTGSRSV